MFALTIIWEDCRARSMRLNYLGKITRSIYARAVFDKITYQTCLPKLSPKNLLDLYTPLFVKIPYSFVSTELRLSEEGSKKEAPKGFLKASLPISIAQSRIFSVEGHYYYNTLEENC